MKRIHKNLSNNQLQILLKQGDEGAFNEIYNRYWSSLYAYAYRIYTEEKICEDIVQEVFISLWEKAKAREITNIEGYLFKAIKFKIATHIRDLKFTSTHTEVLQNIANSNTSEDNIEYEEFKKQVFLEIEKLTPKCKNVFILSRFDQLSNTEISKKLNISIRTVEKHISDALKELKSTLKTNHIIGFVIVMFL
ncbi:RNA polymerase subunit sigma [Pseudalgibacter alginicilyticus]|uniref:RNA polymerase subunit sigma n=1 Tax=Pseudalgibacter alginicilyticus TaxID=1736674 RepID=A0A0N7HY59_9FLAO|nr:RNA polymerase sigma-70 factor [Pseudalgibacter alginicilyticus]ALJ04342.1 RNA polymerase subunit sigma [Pseudalgibacter alginicilyticus]